MLFGVFVWFKASGYRVRASIAERTSVSNAPRTPSESEFHAEAISANSGPSFPEFGEASEEDGDFSLLHLA